MVIASIGLSLSRSSTPVRDFNDFTASRGVSPDRNFSVTTSRGTTPVRSLSRSTTPAPTTGTSLKSTPPEQTQSKPNGVPSSRGTTPVRSLNTSRGTTPIRSTGSSIKSSQPELIQTKPNALPSSRGTTPVRSLNTSRGTTPVRNTTETSLKSTVPEAPDPKTLKSFIKSLKPGQPSLKSVKTKQHAESDQSTASFVTLGTSTFQRTSRASLPKPSSKNSNTPSQFRSASAGSATGYVRRLPVNFEKEEPLPPIFSIFD